MPKWGIVEGVGVCDDGKYPISEDGKLTKWRGLWGGMLYRCYNQKGRSRLMSYEGCSVSPEFLNFQSFMSWAEMQVGFDKGWHLDKDLLVKHNKVYSPETCVFLPSEINSAIVRRESQRKLEPIGVHWRQDRKRFVAQINAFGKTRWLGFYDNSYDAFLAYKKGKIDYMHELAEKWKDEICPKAYKALLEFTPEITD